MASRQLPRAVLLDFSGTLFFIESAHEAVLAALGESMLPLVPELERFGAINGSGMPDELPVQLVDAWRRRDLSHELHRAAYSGSARQAGLTASQAALLYARGVSPEAWHPFPDTVEVLRRLRADGIPVAMVSNIGWDPRPVLAAYGAFEYIDALVLSDERGVMKPDAAIFTMACAELGVDPRDTLMVGDNAEADGGATAIGCGFALVSPRPDRAPDALLQAVGLCGETT